jgi:hypothetical protein
MQKKQRNPKINKISDSDNFYLMTQNKHQKLELTWIGKGEEPKLEPRILIEQPEYSYWAGKEEGKPASWSNKKSGE